MAKKNRKWTKPDKTAAEKMFEQLHKPIPPKGSVMGSRNKKRGRKFDPDRELAHYKESYES